MNPHAGSLCFSLLLALTAAAPVLAQFGPGTIPSNGTPHIQDPEFYSDTFQGKWGWRDKLGWLPGVWSPRDLWTDHVATQRAQAEAARQAYWDQRYREEAAMVARNQALYQVPATVAKHMRMEVPGAGADTMERFYQLQSLQNLQDRENRFTSAIFGGDAAEDPSALLENWNPGYRSTAFERQPWEYQQPERYVFHAPAANPGSGWYQMAPEELARLPFQDGGTYTGAEVSQAAANWGQYYQGLGQVSAPASWPADTVPAYQRALKHMTEWQGIMRDQPGYGSPWIDRVNEYRADQGFSQVPVAAPGTQGLGDYLRDQGGFDIPAYDPGPGFGGGDGSSAGSLMQGPVSGAPIDGVPVGDEPM